MITPEEIKKLFELSRIEPSEEDLTTLPKDLDAILEYIKTLQSVDLKDVAPTLSMAGEVKLRSDEVRANAPGDVELITKQFPDSENGYLRTKKVFEQE
jgi:aspartyl/glutamyl-tRNA(Asn/Gln) amidotransferase C subunit